MDASQDWEPNQMNEQLQVIDVQSVAVAGVSPQATAFAAEQLGPMPGKWNGYDQLDDGIQKKVWSKVGYIHGLSAEAGRQIVEVGKTLLEVKEMLPHGQFMSCVKAEFGWSDRWARSLMQVADRFANRMLTSDLPSSAQVLALLASNNADDATVQQAAEEQWTVKQTRQRLGNERQQERSIVQEAMSVLKLSEEARQLAAKAEHISTRQLMDELGLEELPKGREHKTAQFTFCKNGTGWWKLPIEQPVEVHAAPIDLAPVAAAELLPLAVAAQRLGRKTHHLRCSLTPSSILKNGLPTGNGWQAKPHEKRGYCIVCKIQP
jgi:hypothetical protein